MYISPFSAFNRPGDTTQYAQNELVADNTSAGSVNPMRFNCERIKGHGRLFGVRMWKSTATVTAAKFNLHLYTQAPTPTNGDNAAFAVGTTKWWIATIACDMSTGCEVVSGVDVSQYFALTNPVTFDLELDGQSDGLKSAGKLLSLFGLLETGTGATYSPGSSETFRAVLNIEG